MSSDFQTNPISVIVSTQARGIGCGAFDARRPVEDILVDGNAISKDPESILGTGGQVITPRCRSEESARHPVHIN